MQDAIDAANHEQWEAEREDYYEGEVDPSYDPSVDPDPPACQQDPFFGSTC